MRLSETACQLEVDLKNIDELFPGQTAEGRGRILLEDLFDLVPNLLGIEFLISGPLLRNTIELIFRIVQRDMRIEA